jgi:hypothetical protein
MHAFGYVTPSQPQTGTYSLVQVAGTRMQVPTLFAVHFPISW